MSEKTSAGIEKMGSREVPEEYMDVLFQEFAYDPVRLPPQKTLLSYYTTAGHSRRFG